MRLPPAYYSRAIRLRGATPKFFANGRRGWQSGVAGKFVIKLLGVLRPGHRSALAARFRFVRERALFQSGHRLELGILVDEFGIRSHGLNRDNGVGR